MKTDNVIKDLLREYEKVFRALDFEKQAYFFTLKEGLSFGMEDWEEDR